MMVHRADLMFPEKYSPEMRFTHRGCGLTVRTPSWDDLTVIKPIAPGVKQNKGPAAVDNAGAEHGWYYALPDLLRAVGTRGRLTCLNTPIDVNVAATPHTPYELLQQTIYQRAYKDRPDWRQLFEPVGNRGPALPRPRTHAAIQGTLYVRGEHEMTSNPRQRTLLLLPSSAIRAVQRLLESLSLLEDLLDPASDTLLLLYQASWHYKLERRWRLVHEAEHPPQPCSLRPYGAGRYLARLVKPRHPEHIAAPPKLTPVTPSFVPWDEVIDRPTAQDQLRDFAGVFHPELMLAAYRDSIYESLLPVWLRQRM